MRQAIRRNIPSMFHRRLLLLLLVTVLVSLVLAVRTVQLTMGSMHTQRLSEAESALRVPQLIPTIRGRILDRHGHVLAQDEPGWDVAVDFSVIVGSWAYDQAMYAARRDQGESWAELSPYERDALISEYRGPYDEQVEMLWQTLSDLGRIDRSEIERKKNAIRQRIQNVASHLWAIWRERRKQELDEDVPLASVAKPIQEQDQAHSILTHISESTRAIIQSFIAESSHDDALRVWQEVEVRRPQQRTYPWETRTILIDRSHMPSPLRSDEPLKVTVEGVGMHIIGRMRHIWKEDMESGQINPFRRRDERGKSVTDLAGYLPGDLIGSGGIESGCELRLRGSRGKFVRHLDTGYEDRIEPVPGTDVHLTIDIKLQARIQAIMAPESGLMTLQSWQHPGAESEGRLGQRLNGSAVVLEVETGEVLAAVSMPPLSQRMIRDQPERIFGDHINRPYVNRVVSQPYQPGSTVKPLLFAAAVTAGKVGLEETITCKGYLDEGHPDRYRCWIYKRYMSMHGPLEGVEAIARSCNVFFYTLGRRMGSMRLIDWYGRYGLGRVSHCGLPEEVAGDLPDPDLAGEPGVVGFLPADAIFMGIGQGPIRWTPLQAAAAYATLIRNGAYLSPTFIRGDACGNPRQERNLNLNPSAVNKAMAGLYDVVNESYGTGRYLRVGEKRELIFDFEDLRLSGKSGTAQAVPLRVDSDGDGRITGDDRIVRTGDHGWFIVLVQPPGTHRPAYVVAVVVEYSGSGSIFAGPIANQIVHAMQVEGYID